MNTRHWTLTALILLLSIQTWAQQATLQGKILNAEGEPLEFVNIALDNTSRGTSTDKEGRFTMAVPAEVPIRMRISYLGYAPQTIDLELRAEETRVLEIVMEKASASLPDIEIIGRQLVSTDISRLDPRLSTILPGPSAGVEQLIQTLPGVSSSSELSTQYSVRGGNFDENLVYVNGIEIYRPFLLRSGQQEGLSFLNPEMVESISFSAGGFNALYGDKMSSVLDIEYKSPQATTASFSISLLEGSVFAGGVLPGGKFSYLLGVRYKSNQYLLGTMDTQGDYQPLFTDVQALITYQASDNWTLSFLGNHSGNRYLFSPDVQRTRFGTISEVREFTVFFDGQELTRYQTGMGALSADYRPGENHHIQWTASLFQSDENEQFDIMGRYWLQRVETDFGRDDYGQPTGIPLGIGTFLNHARNHLNVVVANTELKGSHSMEDNNLRWGLKFQHEDIYDRLNEWTMIDSAGYSLPRQPMDEILLQDVLHTQIRLQSQRFSGYIQNTREMDTGHGRFSWTAGLRLNHWTFNNQTLWSPRTTILYKPYRAKRWAFRASAGIYHQPPFYRELRNMEGVLNENIKAQQSLHLVLGSEFNFIAWDRPFKYTAEVYYKKLDQLIPYQLDNIRIRYYAENISSGYATGLDMKINGEFVPGIESWASLSLMRTREKMEGALMTDDEGNLVEAGYMPRPMDHLLNFSMFFQDFLPRNPSYQVQLGFYYNSGLPYWVPRQQRIMDYGRMPAYHRVDIGFSKQLIGADTAFSPQSPLRHVKSMWITAEVFNLLEINNTISYRWIRDVENRLFAIPNYLTRRLINVKLVARF